MLRQRIVTAVVLALAIGVVLLALPPAGAAVTLSVIIAAGAWEWSRFAGLGSWPARLAYVLACGAVMALLWSLAAGPRALHAVLAGALGWWLLAAGWIAFASTRVSRGAAGVAGVLTLGFAWLGLLKLYFAGERGPQFVVFAFILVGAADVGGYFFGRRFGRLKLAPRVSPGKTWEGVIGGFVLGGLAAVAGGAWFGLPLTGFLPLCGAVIVMSVVGDLTESMFKRAAGLKDSGSLLPGHGGVLDRIDGLCAAVPLLLLGLVWLGRVP